MQRLLLLLALSLTPVFSEDIPTWRKGDVWTYETTFDATQFFTGFTDISSGQVITRGDTKYNVSRNQNYEETRHYSLEIQGSFTTGNSGATIEGVEGRIDIEYRGTDLIRVRDLAVSTSEFTLDIKFLPYNLGFLAQSFGEFTFETTYEPPKENYDFPIHLDDQWHMELHSTTIVTGSSDYIDPSQFDTRVNHKSSWQITEKGTPTDGERNIAYNGCDESYKINEVSASDIAQDYIWYCPAVRYNSWISVTNSAGFTIDWLLKNYRPVDSPYLTYTCNELKSEYYHLGCGCDGTETTDPYLTYTCNELKSKYTQNTCKCD